MSKLKIIVGSIRENRNARTVADWLVSQAKDAGYDLEILDLKEIDLPKFNSPISPMYASVDTPEAKAWASQIDDADGIVFLTSEYNRSIPASLKDAIDYLYGEWNDKKVSIVSYGWTDGGGSATKHLTDILNWVKTQIVGPEVAIPFTGATFAEDGSFNDIDATLGGVKDDFLIQLKALSE
ncbi:NAD(P)H-dependent oxidoreductase [Candidatus Saccharibacteria bacterium]|nr:NAD(P)H-dependent oxidoreductase [Candidatus Saccharibacteria bacterium]